MSANYCQKCNRTLTFYVSRLAAKIEQTLLFRYLIQIAKPEKTDF